MRQNPAEWLNPQFWHQGAVSTSDRRNNLEIVNSEKWQLLANLSCLRSCLRKEQKIDPCNNFLPSPSLHVHLVNTHISLFILMRRTPAEWLNPHFCHQCAVSNSDRRKDLEIVDIDKRRTQGHTLIHKHTNTHICIMPSTVATTTTW